MNEIQKISNSLSKEEFTNLVLHYDWYIQDANEKDLYKDGWLPVCIAEFYDNEYQQILEDNLNKDKEAK